MDDTDEVLTESRSRDREDDTADLDIDLVVSPTDLACPIIRERPVGSLEMLRGLALARPRTAVVVVTARGDYLPYTDSPPSTTDLLRRRARYVSEVDLGQHRTRIHCELPSSGDVFRFAGEVDLHWQVSDPVQVVRDGLRDVRAALEPWVLAQLRSVTRGYTEAQSAQAEAKANEALRDLPEAAKFGLSAMALVQFGMDDAVRDRLRLEARVAAYRQMIAAGDLNQFALRLADDRQDVAAVVQSLAEDRDHHRRELVDFVTKLIDSGAIERHQIDDQVRAALQWLQENTHRVITGTDEARRTSLGRDWTPGDNGAPGMPA